MEPLNLSRKTAARGGERGGVCLLAVVARGPDPTLAIDLAYLGGAIERWAGDLALAEEPARFLAALESLGPAPKPPLDSGRGPAEPSR
ncbi:MAG: hypothetical protein ACREJV_11575 [Candidatus Rokuibacteriota bacterium]